MVLMPDSDTQGVSRKIEDESQRKKLKAAMASLDLPEHMGYIVRTAGIGQTNEELKRDFDYLVRVWDNLQTLARQAKAPALIYKESNLVIRSIRDYFSADMDEVLVDDPKVCQEAKDFFQQVMPEFARLVKLHQERRPIFSRYQIEEQIETIVKNKVPLPSGGSIVIDTTEALVAVDVNSARWPANGGGTAYKTTSPPKRSVVSAPGTSAGQSSSTSSTCATANMSARSKSGLDARTTRRRSPSANQPVGILR
jgi:ribonuclease E